MSFFGEHAQKLSLVLVLILVLKSKARFRRRSTNVPNLTDENKKGKRAASEWRPLLGVLKLMQLLLLGYAVQQEPLHTLAIPISLYF